jgi:hypothetical protein
MRVLFAFLVTPALLPLAYIGYLTLAGSPGLNEAKLLAGIVVPLSYAVAFGLGLPAHLVLRLVKESSLPAYLVWGLLIAVIAQFACLDGLIANWHLWWASMLGQITLGPVHTLGGQASWWIYGTASGGLFWLVGRPDKQRVAVPIGVVYDELNRVR